MYHKKVIIIYLIKIYIKKKIKKILILLEKIISLINYLIKYI